MANIVLTNKCNLSCPYCFAKEITKDNEEIFSTENFVKALEFIKTGNNERLGIVGGEPTIHPNFSQILEIISKEDKFNNCIIFTNGLEIDKYIQQLTQGKFNLLINCNSPDNLGNTLYNKLKNNIELLTKYGNKNFILGVNIYAPNVNYSYIFDLLKITKHRCFRFSISIQNDEKENCKDIFEIFEKYKKAILNFYNECIRNEIVPYIDCNGIPLCLMNTELKKAQLKLREIRNNFEIQCNIINIQCGAQVDILPDLTAVRSICYPYYHNCKISDYKTITDLRNYLYNETDKINNSILISPKCKDCKYNIEKLCTICPCFKLKEFKKLKLKKV